MNPVQFSIPLEHPCLPGHFPGQPVVPGVVILDAVQSAIEHEAGALAATRWPQVKFLQPLLPGQQACIELERVDGGGRWRFRVLRDAEVISNGEVVAT